jgi:hypothetical protein
MSRLPFPPVSRFLGSLAPLAAAAVLAGCDSFGPDALRGTYPLYNDAIVESMNQQFLQNIVRLRYRDPVFFLDVASVTASLKLDLSAGLDQSEIGLNGGGDLLKYSFGAAYTTAPTLSYAPLQGENFVKSMLSPIPLETLFALAGSGWSGRRVLGLCVERINGVENAPSASGPTPDLAPERGGRFERLLDLIEAAGRDQLIFPRADPESKAPKLYLRPSPGQDGTAREIKAILGLDPALEAFRVDSDFLGARPDTVSIRTRSLMNIFFYLSQHVDAPKAHQSAGLVTVTRNRDGSEFDWGATSGGRRFHILESEDRPDLAFLAIPYRGHWFYLRDDDLESKSTFMLLMQLFRLQAGAAKSSGPALTLPVR